MTTKEIVTLLSQIKQVLPTFSIPELINRTEKEKESMLAIYVMAFGKLDYKTSLRALQEIIFDEKHFAEFAKAPIPILAQKTAGITENDKLMSINAFK